jgi:hypothetical protein
MAFRAAKVMTFVLDENLFDYAARKRMCGRSQKIPLRGNQQSDLLFGRGDTFQTYADTLKA